MDTNIKTFAHRRTAEYVILFTALCAGYFVFRGSTWVGSKQLHTLMELTATMLALFIAIIALVHYLTKKSNTTLLIGTGFLGTAFLDGYHTLVTSTFFDQMWPSPPASLIPWSWNASRTFLSIIMFISWLAWKREERLGEKGLISEKKVCAAIGLLTICCFAFFALYPLPRAYYPEFFFGRPEELVSAFFFLLALTGYLSKGLWKTDSFEHWVVITLIVGFTGQAIFMSLSFQLFDIMFDMAHMLKKASYICTLVGLLISMYYLFQRAEKQKMLLEIHASTDRLTGAYNRSKFEEIMSKEMERASRYNNIFSTVMFDIDNFKETNDSYGHIVGDYVLKTIVDIARKNIRSLDCLIRWGGEEFMIISPHTDLDGARVLAERIRKAVENYSFDRAGRVTVSLGTAQFRFGDTKDSLTKRADDAMYEAKRNGRNRLAECA